MSRDSMQYGEIVCECPRLISSYLFYSWRWALEYLELEGRVYSPGRWSPVNGCQCCIDEWVDSDGTRKESEGGRKRSKTLC